jgi:Legionella pneumophila major outer membrane protein precursor
VKALSIGTVCLSAIASLSLPTAIVQAQSSPSVASPQSSSIQAQATPAQREQELLKKLQQLEDRQQQLEQEIKNLRQMVQERPTVDGSAGITAQENQRQSIEIFAQPLFIQPNTSNFLDYAIIDPGLALATSGEIARVDFEDAVALRVGVVYRPENTAWDIAASHTFFDTQGSQTAVRPTNGFLFSTFTHPFQNDSANAASARATLDYRATDVELGYNFNVGKSFSTRLFGGIRVAKVEQDLAVDFNGRDFNQARARSNSSFSGFGPRLGSELKLRLAKDLSLFGRGSGMLLLGDVSTSYRETDNAGLDVVADIRQVREKQLLPAVEMALGINWQPRLGPNSQLNVSMGYEYQHLFNVSDSIRFTDSDSPGNFTQIKNDLSMQGLFVRLGLLFEF